jgi:hypothetical protein
MINRKHHGDAENAKGALFDLNFAQNRISTLESSFS